MSPLSAIRQFMSPEVRQVPSVPKAGEAPGINVVPANELKTLSPGSTTAVTATPNTNFGDMLSNMVQDVNAKQVAANDAVNGMMAGDNVSLHQTMIAMEEASVSFQLMVEVRNKLLESYQELMRMQV